MTEAPSLYLRLATYWQRVDDLTEAMRRTDAAAFDTPERDAAFAAQKDFGSRLNEAEQAIAAYVPEWPQEAKIKADFLTYLADGNHGVLTADVVDSLLQSLPRLVRYERASA